MLFQPCSLNLFSWGNHFKAIPIACHSISHDPGASNCPHLWQNSWAASRSLEQQSFRLWFRIRRVQPGSAMLHRLTMFFINDWWFKILLNLQSCHSQNHHAPTNPQPPAATAASGVVARQPCHKVIERRSVFGLLFGSCGSSLCWLNFVKRAPCTIYKTWFNLEFPSTLETPKKLLGSKFLKWFRASAATLRDPPNGRGFYPYLKVLFKPAFCFHFTDRLRGFKFCQSFFRRGTANQKSPRAARGTPRCHQRHRPKKIQKSTLCMLKGRDQVDSVGLSFYFSWLWEPTFGRIKKFLINGDSGVMPWECVPLTLAIKYWWQDEPWCRHLVLLVWKVHFLLGMNQQQSGSWKRNMVQAGFLFTCFRMCWPFLISNFKPPFHNIQIYPWWAPNFYHIWFSV